MCDAGWTGQRTPPARRADGHHVFGPVDVSSESDTADGPWPVAARRCTIFRRFYDEDQARHMSDDQNQFNFDLQMVKGSDTKFPSINNTVKIIDINKYGI